MKRGRAFLGIVALAMLSSACGGSQLLAAVDPPVGDPLLPDLVPAPPVEINVSHTDDGVVLRFSSVLVNVGDGDFILRGERNQLDPEAWLVQQEVNHSEAGALLVDVPAIMQWGGDGHEHWHVARVASYSFVPLDEDGNPEEFEESLIDSKIGFCFFDSDKELGLPGPEDPVWHHETCGHQDDLQFRMGLSPGWGDTYIWSLPGQSFDIRDIPDGRYRLWATADHRGWFTEETTSNNTTWIDLELDTLPEGFRSAEILDTGPTPSEAA